MKLSKDDLCDIFYSLREHASENYDNALAERCFEDDYLDDIFPIDFLIESLPDDFELNIPDKVIDWYKNRPWGVSLADVLRGKDSNN